MLEIPFRNIPVYRLLTFRSLAVVFLLAAASASSLVASAQNAVFKIPPVNIPLEVKDQPITITASATLTLSSRDRDVRIFRLELTGDLVDLQRNLTQLLSSQMNKNDDCGEILTIQNATLTPVDPASLAMVQLHYERRTCVKLFGKRQAKRLVSGDAQIEIKLTPEIEENSTQLADWQWKLGRFRPPAPSATCCDPGHSGKLCAKRFAAQSLPRCKRGRT